MPIRAAKIFVIDGAGHALVLRCSETHPYFALFDDLPGGILDAHEAPAQGALRELIEETGLKVAASQLSLLHTAKDSKSNEWFIYEVRLPQIQPPVTLSYEHDLAEWMPLNRLFARPLQTKGNRLYDIAIAYRQTHN